MCDITGFVSETTNNDESVWLADSGASMHMSSRHDFFQQIQPVKSVKFVKVAGERMLKVAGVGTIDIDAVVNSKHVGRKLEKVLYVPDLKRSLFSVGAIADKGFSFHIYNDRCEVRERNDTLSVEGVHYGQLLRTRFNTKIPIQYNVAHENTLKLWHERLGHINIRSIWETEEIGAVYGLKIKGSDDNFFCEACVLRKRVQKPHFSSRWEKLKKPGEMIHSDVCGPINFESPKGSRYFVLFKDDNTGFRTVYFMRRKAEVLEKFNEFEASVVKQTNNSIKILRTDNGTEYLSNEFKDFLRLKGIVHETSTPYVPQQNGRAERELRTLVEIARSMLIARNVSKMLWAEAVLMAAYILNRTISKELNGRTAYENWFGRKPEIKHLRVFGCDAYKNIPKGQRKKFDPKSKKMILVGYDGDSTNYRLWDAEDHRIHISCNVDFNEAERKTESTVNGSDKGNRGPLRFGNISEEEGEATMPQPVFDNPPEERPEDHLEDSSKDDNEEAPTAQTASDHCVFLGKVKDKNVFLALYIDDGLLMSKSKLAITEILNNLSHKFQITVSEPKHFIGMEIERNRLDQTIKIGQSRYIQRILEKFWMEEANAGSADLMLNTPLTRRVNFYPIMDKDIGRP
ncbi:hypothetical protein KM043_014312 [Ampulex compressa]|nr:hypothetical protein KM043_014312 [Ampulex compressa]